MAVLVKGMFGVKIPYNAKAVADIRKIDARRWDAKEKIWWFLAEELTLVAKTLAPYFPAVSSRLLTSPRYEEVRNVTKKNTEAIALSYATTSTLDVPHPEGIDYMPYQYAGIEFAYNLWKKDNTTGVLLGDDMGLGKCQPLTSPVLTPSGFVPMGGMYVGAPVIGRDGLPHTVTGVYPQGIQPVYRVTFSNGEGTECGAEHLWSVSHVAPSKGGNIFQVKTTKELLAGLDGATMDSTWYIPMVAPVEFIMSLELEILLRAAGIREKGITEFFYEVGLQLSDASFPSPKGSVRSIPDVYKYAPAEYRLSLLRGIMSANGQWPLDAAPLYTSHSIGFIRDIQFIVESLGGEATITDIQYPNHCWGCSIILPDGVSPFLSSGAAEAGKVSDVYIPQLSIASIEYVGEKECQCIMVDSPDHLYITDHFIATHNTVIFLGLVNKIRETTGYLGKTLIVCPATLKRNWMRECQRWLTHKSPVVLMETGMPASMVKRHPVVVINYDILDKYLDALYEVDWNVLCFDEAHYVKTPSTKRSTAARLLGQNKGFVSMLSGTPIENRPNEVWHLLHIIDQSLWGSYAGFCRRYFPPNGNGIRVPHKMDELAKKLRTTYMIRRHKADVLLDLPPKIRQVVELDKKGFEKILKQEAAARSEYEKIEEEVGSLEAKLTEAIKGQNKANEDSYREAIAHIRSGTLGAMSEISKIRHATAVAKVPKCIEFIRNTLEEKDKVVVFAHHRDVIEQVAEAFKGSSVLLYGGMSSDAKDKAVQAFMHDPKIKVIVLSIMAGGVGLTLTVADTVVFVELDWSPSKNTQAEDRCYRISQKSTVFVYHLVVEDSIDANIAKKCIEKQIIIEEALEVK